MDIKQTLEQVAQVGGYNIVGWKKDGNGVDVAILANHTFWQPLLRNSLTDCMGDALRLAIRFGINITPDVYPVYSEDQLQAVASANYFSKDGMPKQLRISEEHERDPDNAVCSVIVRAALEKAQNGYR